jgi:hypothetical protein
MYHSMYQPHRSGLAPGGRSLVLAA